MVRRDPHDVLGVAPGTGAAAIKAAWRRLARQHHPDLAATTAERRAATRRMAEINAAYAELRDGVPPRGRRPGDADHGATGRASGRAGRDEPQNGSGPAHGAGTSNGAGARRDRPSGPPPPPAARPVTARFDTSDLLHPRNATTTPRGGGFRHHPRGRHPPQARAQAPEPPRSSDPTGPLERLRSRRSRRRPLPTLEEAQARTVSFGKFHGRTLGEIAAREPSYVTWLARAITRDPDLLDAARVLVASREVETSG